MQNTIKSLPKAIALSLAVVAMLPVASSWEHMFGSIHNTITVDAAVEEKARMEEEIEKMRLQMEKLTALIEKLEEGK